MVRLVRRCSPLLLPRCYQYDPPVAAAPLAGRETGIEVDTRIRQARGVSQARIICGFESCGAEWRRDRLGSGVCHPEDGPTMPYGLGLGVFPGRGVGLTVGVGTGVGVAVGCGVGAAVGTAVGTTVDVGVTVAAGTATLAPGWVEPPTASSSESATPKIARLTALPRNAIAMTPTKAIRARINAYSVRVCPAELTDRTEVRHRSALVHCRCAPPARKG